MLMCTILHNSLFCSWLLFEKPGFQGRTIALEEGSTEQIENVWAEEKAQDQLVPTAPMVIGSIKLAVRVRTPLKDNNMTLLFSYDCKCFLVF